MADAEIGASGEKTCLALLTKHECTCVLPAV
jgi:hypothetical protein